MSREPNLDPAYLQRNVESLSAIGGAYDFLAIMVEEAHKHILIPWRAEHGGLSAYELIERQRPGSFDTEAPTQ